MAWGKEWFIGPNTLIKEYETLPKEWPIQAEAEKSYSEAASISEDAWNNLKVRNKVPTHDPYTNPGAMVYYECNCGAILDPKTKSFAALNNAASMAGWKIRFGDVGYVPYCSKCGEGVE